MGKVFVVLEFYFWEWRKSGREKRKTKVKIFRMLMVMYVMEKNRVGKENRESEGRGWVCKKLGG